MRHLCIAYALAAASALAPQRLAMRRQLIGGACSTLLAPTLENALVKGSAPPPKASRGEKRTCKTIDECEEVGRQRAAAAFDAGKRALLNGSGRWVESAMQRWTSK